MIQLFEKKAMIIEESNSSLSKDNLRILQSFYKRCDNINYMINKAIDSDGDPIPVIDKDGTAEIGVIYFPIEYNGTIFTIKSKEVMKSDITTEVFDLSGYFDFMAIPNNDDMEFTQEYYQFQDLSETLKYIDKLYTNLFRKK